jgi:hypothetical protein
MFWVVSWLDVLLFILLVRAILIIMINEILRAVRTEIDMALIGIVTIVVTFHTLWSLAVVCYIHSIYF